MRLPVAIVVNVYGVCLRTGQRVLPRQDLSFMCGYPAVERASARCSDPIPDAGVSGLTGNIVGLPGGSPSPDPMRFLVQGPCCSSANSSSFFSWSNEGRELTGVAFLRVPDLRDRSLFLRMAKPQHSGIVAKRQPRNPVFTSTVIVSPKSETAT